MNKQKPQEPSPSERKHLLDDAEKLFRAYADRILTDEAIAANASFFDIFPEEVLESSFNDDTARIVSRGMMVDSQLHGEIVRNIENSTAQETDAFKKTRSYLIGAELLRDLLSVFLKIVHIITTRRADPAAIPENEVEARFLEYMQRYLDEAKSSDPELQDATLDHVFKEGFNEIGAPIPGRFRSVIKIALVCLPPEFLDLDKEPDENSREATADKTAAVVPSVSEEDRLSLPFPSIPNGEIMSYIFLVLAGFRSGKYVLPSEKEDKDVKKHLQPEGTDRHRSLAVTEYQGGLKFSFRTDKDADISIRIKNRDEFIGDSNKPFTKIFTYILQKWAEQNFPNKVYIHFQDLVDLGMYSRTTSAKRGFLSFFEKQSSLSIFGKTKKATAPIQQAETFLFSAYALVRGGVFITVAEDLNPDFIATYFTLFPNWIYSLGYDAFLLARYIFSIARQRCMDIDKKGFFTIKLETIRYNLGIPDPETVKKKHNSKYQDLIISPIENAIREIEDRAKNEPEAQDKGFTITLCNVDTDNVHSWLTEGYLEIGMSGYKPYFAEIAKKSVAKIREREALVHKAQMAILKSKISKS